MTKEYWEDVAKNISSFGNSEDNEHCLKILSLSYRSLPIHLKPCFLYLRVYREDADISCNTLINRWIAEGFIRPTSDKTVEENAEQYVYDLVNRSLMFEKEGHYGTYGVHDLLWDLCVKESDKESFLQSPNFFETTLDARSETGHCLLCGKLTGNDDVINICEKSLHFPPSSHDDCHVGVACDVACQKRYSHIPKLKLVTAMAFQMGPDMKKALQFSTELRYLKFWGNDPIVFHQTIHLLWNLETLDIFLSDSPPILLPSEIWEMPRLRHIRVQVGAFLANPTATQIEGYHFIVLKYLHTLYYMRNFKCTKEVIDRIPNLKHLHIRYEIDESMHRGMMQPYYSLCNIEQLHKLESLEVESARENITFPNSLKKLTLSNCQMAWEDMSIIGSLPVLEELDFHGHEIEGSEWNAVEGEFLRLKVLRIGCNGLKCWRADSIHFPRLEQLHLWLLPSLEGIPLGIGDIPTLQLIRVSGCSRGARASARQIKEDQSELGNEIKLGVLTKF